MVRFPEEDLFTREEREAYQEDLIAFCDRELDLLGDIRGLDILYAGGASPLWIEGLAERVGEEGSLAALELSPDEVLKAAAILNEDAIRVRLVIGDVFDPPFGPGAFDLVYSAGMFHELQLKEEPAEKAISKLASVVRPGGRVATGDFVDCVPAAQIEEEGIQADCARELFGRELYGIGPPERLVSLHESVLSGVRWSVSPPYPLRHLDKLVLAEKEPPGWALLSGKKAAEFRVRRQALRERVRREGYTRPATLYVEGTVPLRP